ncbi:serine hydrolase domain-containing protein [Phaeodactylibacter luteus]|uniref:Beta-lactamase family protein n=1 Tax=Phaeodactylibacter luteus TaxID=1564516 RepID=A0A5C6RLS4_9BACT|nr:serine hydrolase domain-containing protein [Phaeodactylibacter luteus]TXB63187.1 beta-lactamase family protein [Phaeodactylibacter luteus]
MKNYLFFPLLLLGLNATGQPDFTAQLGALSKAHSRTAFSAAVIQDGKISYFNAQPRRGRAPAANEKSIYELGALTGPFTALLMLRLSEKGRIAPGQPLTDYLPDSLCPPPFQPARCTEMVLPGTPPRLMMSCSPDLARAGRTPTFCELAAHTSGLPNAGLGHYDWHPGAQYATTVSQPPSAAAAYPALLAGLTQSCYKNEPGTAWHFSNAGMAVLGHSLAIAEGQPFAYLLETEVAGPLGLADTQLELNPEQRTRFMSTEPATLPIMGPAAGLKSTTTDLAQLLYAYLNSESHPWESILLESRQPRVDANFPGFAYPTTGTYGWLSSYLAGPKAREIIWMNGGTEAFSAFAGFDPDNGQAVVLLCNKAGVDLTKEGIKWLQELPVRR